MTNILERAGNKKLKVAGADVARKHVIAELIWEAATTGRATFPDGRLIEVVDGVDWFNVLKFLYSHIDGPPKAALELSGDPARPVTPARTFDAAGLSDAELEQLEALLSKAAAQPG